MLERDLAGCPAGLGGVPGGGAAGGIGAALLALGGAASRGSAWSAGRPAWTTALDTADLVITGEGSFDQQSLRGKVVAGVAGAARDRGVPCVVVAGQVSTGRREAASAGVTDAYSLVEHFGGGRRARRRAEPARRGAARDWVPDWPGSGAAERPGRPSAPPPAAGVTPRG